MVERLFPESDEFFQGNDSPIHTARSVQSWFEELEDALRHLPWPPQMPDLKRTHHAISTNVSNAPSHNTYK
jgi:heme oxygenase